MLDKTKRLAPAIALLTILVSLPIAQVQADANVKLDDRTTTEASRSAQRYPYASVNYNKKFAKTYQKSVYKWGDQEYGCLVTLWNHESGWRVNAHNHSSGAHGIPQSLPGSKMASAGPNWISNPHTQIKWGLKYIKNRYTTPCGAWSFWQRHHWY